MRYDETFVSGENWNKMRGQNVVIIDELRHRGDLNIIVWDIIISILSCNILLTYCCLHQTAATRVAQFLCPFWTNFVRDFC